MLLLAYWINAFADLPKENLYNQILLPKSNILVKNTPYTIYGEQGKFEVMDLKDSSIIYSVNRFFRFKNYFSENGLFHVTIDDWFVKGRPDNRTTVISFYKKGRLLRKYSVRDLRLNHPMLIETVSHKVWLKEVFIKSNILHVLTVDNIYLTFSMKNGRLNSRTQNSSSLFQLNNNQFIIQHLEFDFKQPYIENLITSTGESLDTIISTLLYGMFPTDKKFLVGLYISKEGIPIVETLEFNNLKRVKEKARLSVTKAISAYRLTNFEIEPPYEYWGKMVYVGFPNRRSSF